MWQSVWFVLLVSAVVGCVGIIFGMLCSAEVVVDEVVDDWFLFAVGWLCVLCILGLRRCGRWRRGGSCGEDVTRWEERRGR